MLNKLLYFPLRFPLRMALAAMWLLILVALPSTQTLLSDYGFFALLGIIGAIFANATGAGGGVVFVPFFNYLQFDATSIVATSFGIQCCGMTAGAITWWRFKTQLQVTQTPWSSFNRGLAMTVPASLVGIAIAQYGPEFIGSLSVLKGGIADLHIGFGLFSILLALAIFASIPLLNKQTYTQTLSAFDRLALPVVGVVGGIVTAWLSVGVGELVAVYLIIRGFNVTMAIALAVVLSAITVWGAIIYHLFLTQAIIWQVVLFAGAGAIIGGMVAKYVVLAFSPQKLKVFFGSWVLLLGLSGLPVF